MTAQAIDLSGKVALVTGAGRPRGLGAGIARCLAGAGARIVVCDRDEAGVAALAEEIGARGGEALACRADVTCEEDVAALVDAAVAHFGGLDILVNNAGIGDRVGPVEQFAVEDWDAVLAVNLKGAFLGIKHAARAMIARGTGGRIISIGSQASKSGVSLMAAYAASKHGLIGLTRSAAIELGRHGITVNAVCPNHIPNDLGDWQRETLAQARGWSMEDYWSRFRARVPLGRTGSVEDAARACLFLASDLADYITGEALNVSGGEEYH
ncbi:SDR family oxidoreductase [Novosphingobium profundi]|uniref:SDR family NAD(P)-dependent oxidoreductase n=1 Tax=Novosphingobium profundi TaxID=1774954 RepID=UPI001BD96403|nr:SDR family NAD(P)-dependent oxidoreductase [Novosphingobium profundi]MBT0669232.1 SDR family oxidoreductase [Novosphingobium profundi]